MRDLKSFLLGLLLLAGFLYPLWASESEAETRARETAGEYKSDGFRLIRSKRSSHLSAEESKTYSASLIVSTRYLVVVASDADIKELAVLIFNEAGEMVETKAEKPEANRIAIKFTPSSSGKYYIFIKNLRGDGFAQFYLLTS